MGLLLPNADGTLVESGPPLPPLLDALDNKIKAIEDDVENSLWAKAKRIIFVFIVFGSVALYYMSPEKKVPQEALISAISKKNAVLNRMEINETSDNYFILKGNRNFSDCLLRCLDSCSYLAVIHSVEEEDNILKLLGAGASGNESAWIGTIEFEDHWRNQDNIPVNYTNWERGEPKKDPGNQKDFCAAISLGSKKWKARECHEKLPLCICHNSNGTACRQNFFLAQSLPSYLLSKLPFI